MIAPPVALLHLAAPTGAGPAAPPLAIVAARGDEALVRRLVAEHGIDASATRAGWNEWILDVLGAFFRWLGDLIGRTIQALGVTVPGLERIAVAVVSIAALLLAVAAVRAVLRRRRRAEGGRVDVESHEVGHAAARDAEAWRRRLDARLAAGDVAGALEACWWWIARSLGAEAVDPAWTSGELVRRCRRDDLRPGVGALDGFIYGPRQPSAAEVGALVSRLEGDLR